MDDKLLLSKFPHTRMNKEKLLKVYRAFEDNPNKSIAEIKAITGLTSSFWTYYKTLKDAGVLTHTESFNRAFHFKFKHEITDGEHLGGKFSFLAAYLTRFEDDEKPYGFSMTKKEILTRIAIEPPTLENLRIMQELLAVGSLVSKDLTAFTNMSIKVNHKEEEFQWI